MKCFKFVLIACLFVGVGFAQEKVTINFNNTPVEDVIQFVSKTLGKNVLLTERLSGNVNFISHEPIELSELLPFLRKVLVSKGFTIVENESGYLEVVKANQALAASHIGANKEGMQTTFLALKYAKPSEILDKVKHLRDGNGMLVPDDAKSYLIISDYPENISKIKSLLHRLDAPIDKISEFVSLEHNDASEIHTQVTEILNSMNDRFKTPIKVILIKQSNTLALIGDSEDVQKAIDLVRNFDVENPKERIFTKVVPLNNAKASELFTILQAMVKSLQAGKENTIGIAAKEDINAIAISGNATQIAILENTVKELDIEKKQVYIHAKIFEVSQSNLKDLGIKWGLTGGYTDDVSILTSTFNMGGSYFALPSEMTDILDLDAQNKGLGIGAMVNLLKQNGVVDTLSEPTLLGINNIPSSIYVGKTKSIMTSSATGDNVNDITRNTFTREDIGLTLNITPQIAEDNKVMLDIEAVTEDVDMSDSSSVDRPTTTKREIKTASIVQNGESVIIGGLIKDYTSITKTKVPFLGDLPFMGALFRNENRSTDKINLVMILTPYIVRNSEELTRVQTYVAKLDSLEKELAKTLEAELKTNKGNF